MVNALPPFLYEEAPNVVAESLAVDGWKFNLAL